MSEDVRNKPKQSQGFAVAIVLLGLIIIASVICFFVFNTSAVNKTITAENYQTLMDELGDEIGDKDEAYYLSYAFLYYTYTDAVTAALAGNDVEAAMEGAMMVNIYGKTPKQLIDEGKQLMEDDGVTLEEVKETVDDLVNNYY